MDNLERIAIALERIANAVEAQTQCQKNQAFHAQALQMASIGDTPIYKRFLEIVKDAGNAQTL